VPRLRHVIVKKKILVSMSQLRLQKNKVISINQLKLQGVWEISCYEEVASYNMHMRFVQVYYFLLWITIHWLSWQPAVVSLYAVVPSHTAVQCWATCWARCPNGEKNKCLWAMLQITLTLFYLHDINDNIMP
jgi:hypothetical protein